VSKKSIVMSALAVAVGAGAADAATSSPPMKSNIGINEISSPAISPAVRDVLLRSASEVGKQSTSRPYQVAAKKKFKLFDNGPSFVKAVRPKQY
jgi:hypothetical protein